MKNILIILIILISLLSIISIEVRSQCDNDNSSLGIMATPTQLGLWSSISGIEAGHYVEGRDFVAGNTYRIFTGTRNEFDSQLTIYNSDGEIVDYNDDFYGLQAMIRFQPSVSGNYKLLLDEYNCIHNDIDSDLIISLVDNGSGERVLRMVYPDHFAGTTLTVGESVYIYYSDNIDENIKLELYQCGLYHSLINYSLESTGGYFWEVPEALGTGYYQIKISSTTDDNLFDLGYEFYIYGQDPNIDIISPNSATIWNKKEGEQYEITWESNFCENVDIDLYKNGSYIQAITFSEPNDGSYLWEIPSDISPGNDYQIKIINEENESIFNLSDQFVIEENIFTVISPSNGETEVSLTPTLSWEYNNHTSNTIYGVWWEISSAFALIAETDNKEIDLINESTITNLEYNTEYCWQVGLKDESDYDNLSDVWCFTTKVENLNNPPNKPSNLNPVNYSTVENNVVLSWDCSDPDGDELIYDLYFGLYGEPATKFTIYDKEYHLSYLEPGYYNWEVYARDSEYSIGSGVYYFTLQESTNINTIDSKLNIYPNPTNGTLIFKSSLELSQIKIYDMLSRLVYKSEFKPEINISNLNEGMYFLKLFNKKNENVFTQKIMLNK